MLEAFIVITRRSNEEFSFVWIHHEFVVSHPDLKVLNTAGQFKQSTSNIPRDSRIKCQKQLHIVSIYVIEQRVLTNNLPNDMGIQGENLWPNNRPLWDAIFQMGLRRDRTLDTNLARPPTQVGLKPSPNSTAKAKVISKTLKGWGYQRCRTRQTYQSSQGTQLLFYQWL